MGVADCRRWQPAPKTCGTLCTRHTVLADAKSAKPAPRFAMPTPNTGGGCIRQQTHGLQNWSCADTRRGRILRRTALRTYASALTSEFSGFARFLRGVRWNDGFGVLPAPTFNAKENDMFGMLESLAKAAVAVVTVPVAAVADVVTLGGVLTDKEGTYTGEAVSDAMQNLKDAAKPK